MEPMESIVTKGRKFLTRYETDYGHPFLFEKSLVDIFMGQHVKCKKGHYCMNGAVLEGTQGEVVAAMPVACIQGERFYLVVEWKPYGKGRGRAYGMADADRHLSFVGLGVLHSGRSVPLRVVS